MFTFLVPTKIIFGLNATTKIREEVEKNGSRRILLVTDAVVEKAGLLNQVSSQIPQDLKMSTYNRIEPEPRIEIAEDLTSAARSFGPQVVIGVGGGSVLDLAKITSVMLTNPGLVSDYCQQILNVETFKSPGRLLILVPTTAGTGSEVSNTSMLVKSGMKIFLRSRFLFPEVAIVDPQLTVTMPPRVTAATGLDALSHAIEGLMSSNSSALTDALALKAVELISRNLPRAYRNAADLEARTGMSMAATIAGMVLNAGMVYGHSIAYTIATRYNLSHGVSCAIPLPYIMAYNLNECVEKLRQLAIALGDKEEGLTTEEAARRSTQVVRNLIQQVGVPTDLKSIGVPKEILRLLATECIERYPRPNNPKPLQLENAIELYNRMWEGRLE